MLHFGCLENARTSEGNITEINRRRRLILPEQGAQRSGSTYLKHTTPMHYLRVETHFNQVAYAGLALGRPSPPALRISRARGIASARAAGAGAGACAGAGTGALQGVRCHLYLQAAFTRLPFIAGLSGRALPPATYTLKLPGRGGDHLNKFCTSRKKNLNEENLF